MHDLVQVSCGMARLLQEAAGPVDGEAAGCKPLLDVRQPVQFQSNRCSASVSDTLARLLWSDYAEEMTGGLTDLVGGSLS